MQDLAGEYTTCDIVPNNQLGAWTLPGIVTPQRKLPVGMLMDYVEGMGLTRQEQDSYAKEIFTKWIAQNPYMRQVQRGLRSCMNPFCKPLLVNESMHVPEGNNLDQKNFCQLCIPIYLLFSSLFAPTVFRKCEIRNQGVHEDYISRLNTLLE